MMSPDGSFVRSMLGPQVSSSRSSAPVFGFGSSTRDQMAKIYISAEHAKLSTKTISPGPALYMMRSTVGPQVDGSLETAPQWAFGSAQRFVIINKENVPGPGSYEQRSSMGAQGSSLMPTRPVFGMGSSTRDNVQRVYISEKHSSSIFTGVNSPGPASYTLHASVGRQGASTKGNQPSWVFGSNKRFRNPDLIRAAHLPAPDAYGAANGLGPQASSTKRSAPLPGFGTSNRAHAAKLFMTPAHEKINYGKASPGPNTYLPPVQQRIAPSYGFGGCDRWYTRKIADRIVPKNVGPGSYNI